MADLIDLVSEKRWDLVAVFILLAIIAVIGPIAIKGIVASTIKEELKETTANIQEIKSMYLAVYVEQGIAAYKKFEGLEGQELLDKLESSTQNTASAHIALRIPEARSILEKIDRDLTYFLIDYFKVE